MDIEEVLCKYNLTNDDLFDGSQDEIKSLIMLIEKVSRSLKAFDRFKIASFKNNDGPLRDLEIERFQKTNNITFAGNPYYFNCDLLLTYVFAVSPVIGPQIKIVLNTNEESNSLNEHLFKIARSYLYEIPKYNCYTSSKLPGGENSDSWHLLLDVNCDTSSINDYFDVKQSKEELSLIFKNESTTPNSYPLNIEGMTGFLSNIVSCYCDAILSRFQLEKDFYHIKIYGIEQIPSNEQLINEDQNTTEGYYFQIDSDKCITEILNKLKQHISSSSEEDFKYYFRTPGFQPSQSPSNKLKIKREKSRFLLLIHELQKAGHCCFSGKDKDLHNVFEELSSKANSISGARSSAKNSPENIRYCEEFIKSLSI